MSEDWEEHLQRLWKEKLPYPGGPTQITFGQQAYQRMREWIDSQEERQVNRPEAKELLEQFSTWLDENYLAGVIPSGAADIFLDEVASDDEPDEYEYPDDDNAREHAEYTRQKYPLPTE